MSDLSDEERALIERMRLARSGGYNDFGGAAIDALLDIADALSARVGVLTDAVDTLTTALNAVDRKAAGIRLSDSAWTARGLASEQRSVVANALARLAGLPGGSCSTWRTTAMGDGPLSDMLVRVEDIRAVPPTARDAQDAAELIVIADALSARVGVLTVAVEAARKAQKWVNEAAAHRRSCSWYDGGSNACDCGRNALLDTLDAALDALAVPPSAGLVVAAPRPGDEECDFGTCPMPNVCEDAQKCQHPAPRPGTENDAEEGT